jgi:hypothetical protein
MSVSMIYLPGTQVPPRPGAELVAELRHTATHFDRVAIVNAADNLNDANDGAEPAACRRMIAAPMIPAPLPRQGTTGVRPAACAGSVSSA